jgi:hypothetical protein
MYREMFVATCTATASNALLPASSQAALPRFLATHVPMLFLNTTVQPDASNPGYFSQRRCPAYRRMGSRLNSVGNRRPFISADGQASRSSELTSLIVDIPEHGDLKFMHPLPCPHARNLRDQS